MGVFSTFDGINSVYDLVYNLYITVLGHLCNWEYQTPQLKINT